MRTRKLHLVSYDNGHQYEDHDRSPVLVCATKRGAEAVVAEMAAWVEKQKFRLPPCPHETTKERADAGQEPLTDGEYVAMNEVREARLAKLRLCAPYGIGDMADVVAGGHGYLVINEIPFQP